MILNRASTYHHLWANNLVIEALNLTQVTLIVLYSLIQLLYLLNSTVYLKTSPYLIFTSIWWLWSFNGASEKTVTYYYINISALPTNGLISSVILLVQRDWYDDHDVYATWDFLNDIVGVSSSIWNVLIVAGFCCCRIRNSDALVQYHQRRLIWQIIQKMMLLL